MWQVVLPEVSLLRALFSPRAEHNANTFLLHLPRDTLKRHVAGHGEAAMAEFTQQHARTRACTSCARAKQRCDGGRPCSTCQDRDNEVECRYPMEPVPEPENLMDPLPSASALPPPPPVSVPPPGMPGDGDDGGLGLSLGLSLGLGLPSWDHLMADLGPPYWSSTMAGGQIDVDIANSTLHPYAEPPTSLDEQDSLHAEDHRHVDSIPAATYGRMLDFACLGDVDESRSECPPLPCFAVYVQLYFEHFHPRMPFLHLPTFDVSADNWACVLAVACIGSQYSAHTRHVQHWLWLTRVVRRLLQREVN